MKRFIKNYLRVHRRFRLLPQCYKINICLVTPFLYLFDIFDCYSYICFLDFNCKKQFKNVFFLSKMRWSHWTFPGEICATALFSIFPRISPSFLFKITGPRSSCSRPAAELGFWDAVRHWVATTGQSSRPLHALMATGESAFSELSRKYQINVGHPMLCGNKRMTQYKLYLQGVPEKTLVCV